LQICNTCLWSRCKRLFARGLRALIHAQISFFAQHRSRAAFSARGKRFAGGAIFSAPSLFPVMPVRMGYSQRFKIINEWSLTNMPLFLLMPILKRLNRFDPQLNRDNRLDKIRWLL